MVVTSPLQVKKQPLPITLLMADGSRRGGTIYLERVSEHHSGPQTIGQLMNDGSPLLYFQEGGDRFQLVSKSLIAAVQARLVDDAEGFEEQIPVVARLIGGHVLQGKLFIEPGHHRPSDGITDGWLRIDSAAGPHWINATLVTALDL